MPPGPKLPPPRPEPLHWPFSSPLFSSCLLGPQNCQESGPESVFFWPASLPFCSSALFSTCLLGPQNGPGQEPAPALALFAWPASLPFCSSALFSSCLFGAQNCQESGPDEPPLVLSERWPASLTYFWEDERVRVPSEQRQQQQQHSE